MVNYSAVCVVAAIKDDVTEYWIAATDAKEAHIAVQLHAGPKWEIKVTDQKITLAEARKLGVRPGEVRRLELNHPRRIIRKGPSSHDLPKFIGPRLA